MSCGRFKAGIVQGHRGKLKNNLHVFSKQNVKKHKSYLLFSLLFEMQFNISTCFSIFYM